MRRFGVLAAVLVASVAGSSRDARAQLPTVPGYGVSLYAQVTDPVRLSFDRTTGALFVGRDNSGSGGTNGEAVRIHRVGPGGAPVEEYGLMAILDPDALLFDAAGTAAEGAAGSVLVGGVVDFDAQLVAVRPDQMVEVIDGPSTVYDNPTDFVADGTGRVLMADARTDATGQVLVVSGAGAPVPLITIPGATALVLAVDGQDRIYVSDGAGAVQQFDATGALLEAAYVTGLLPGAAIAVGPGGPFGSSLYAIDDGDLVRVDAPGVLTPIGSGFGSVSDLEFGPDGALYVSQFDLDRVLRIDAPFSADWEAYSALTPEQVCPPWTLTDSADPEDPVLAGDLLTLATSADAENMSYLQTAPAVAMPETFVFEARVRVVSGASSGANRAPGFVGFTTAPGVGGLFFLAADEIFLTAAGDTKGASALVDTDDTLHTYRIVVDGTAAGSPITVFYDGVPTLTGALYADAPSLGPVERVFWGEGSNLAFGTLEWERVRHNAAVCVPPTTTTTSVPSSTTTTTTSSTTTTTTSSTTTTTLPPGGCDGIPDGPTFASIRCRVEVLRERVLAEAGLGTFQAKLEKKLGKALANLDASSEFCAASDVKKAKKRLKKVAKALSQYVHRLGSLAARKKLEAALREEFQAAGEPIAADAAVLRDQVACPGDATG
jgi:hypothetical protein